MSSNKPGRKPRSRSHHLAPAVAGVTLLLALGMWLHAVRVAIGWWLGL